MTRLIRTPFMHADGQAEAGVDDLAADESVELDGAWVHVVRHDALQSAVRIRSYPVQELKKIIWQVDDCG